MNKVECLKFLKSSEFIEKMEELKEISEQIGKELDKVTIALIFINEVEKYVKAMNEKDDITKLFTQFFLYGFYMAYKKGLENADND